MIFFASAINLRRPVKKAKQHNYSYPTEPWILNFVLKVKAKLVYVKDFHVAVVLVITGYIVC